MNNIFALRSFAEEDNLLFDFIDGVLVNKRVAQIGFFDIFGDIQVPFPEFFVLRTILLDIDQQYYGALGELNQGLVQMHNLHPGGHTKCPVVDGQVLQIICLYLKGFSHQIFYCPVVGYFPNDLA